MCTKGGVFTMDNFCNIPVKYNPNGICNTISLKTMTTLFPMSHKSNGMAAFKVHVRNGIIASPVSRVFTILTSTRPGRQIRCAFRLCTKTSRDSPEDKCLGHQSKETPSQDGKFRQGWLGRHGAWKIDWWLPCWCYRPSQHSHNLWTRICGSKGQNCAKIARVDDDWYSGSSTGLCLTVQVCYFNCQHHDCEWDASSSWEVTWNSAYYGRIPPLVDC